MMKRTILVSAIALLAAPVCAQSITNVGGFDSGSLPIQTATPANSSHALGVSIGGLFSVPIARTLNGGAIATQYMEWSAGGAAIAELIRIWDVKPVNTTCTDNTAFASSATDDKHLVTPPFTVTLAAPSVTTGDSKTYATYGFSPPISIRNQDATGTQFVYVCVVAGATDTADQNNAVYVNVTGPQD